MYPNMVDARVGFAINALQDGEEVSIAVKESTYILRVAYVHLREHHTHKDEVEDIIEIYESDELTTIMHVETLLCDGRWRLQVDTI